jgi:hypothetical protein
LPIDSGTNCTLYSGRVIDAKELGKLVPKLILDFALKLISLGSLELVEAPL